MSDWQPAIITFPNSHGAFAAEMWANSAGRKIRIRPATPGRVLAESHSYGCDAKESEYVEVHPDDVAIIRPDFNGIGIAIACKHYFITD